MTDQDPTQSYQPPAEPAAPPPAPEQGPVVEPPPPPAPPAAQPEAAPAIPAYVAAGSAVATAPEPAAAAPEGASRKTGRNPLKWIVAAVVVLVVAGLAFGATRILTSEAGDPAVLAWTPADSVVYGELRLDLPGSQSAELPKVMKAFPGFEDQAAFPVKLSEVLDRLVGAASGGAQAYKADIDPWFNGQIGGSVGPVPATADPAAGRALVLLGTKDSTKASAWASGLVQESGATTSTETYNGVTITLVTPKDGAGASGGMHGAYAIVGPTLAIGDVASVKASIDTGGTKGLPSVPQFQEAEASVSGDRLGFAYLDMAAIVGGAQGLLGDAAASMIPELPAFLTSSPVPWMAASLQAKDGSLTVDTRWPHGAGSDPAKNTESKIPGLVPPTTVVLVEGHDAAAALARAKKMLAAEPSLKDTVAQVDQALALFGGFEGMTGWMDEAGIVVTRDGDSIAGGLVLTPTDAAAAERLFSQVTGLIQLGGGSAGLSVTTEDHNGTTITLLNLGGLGGILGQATGGAVEAPSDLSIAYAVTDDVVVIGSSPAFAKSVLDAGSGESLADTERFSTSLKQAGTKQSALAWIDVIALRGLVESMVPEASRSDYDANLKPYLAGFDTVMGTLVPGESLDAGTLIIRVTGG